MSARTATLIALGAVAVVQGIVLAITGADAFWIGDEAVKFLQVEAVLESGWREPALAWAGSAVDPTLESNPLPAPFTLVRDGRLQAQYTPVLALVSAVPYQWFGRVGLYLLPFASSVLLLAGVARLARILSPRPQVGALAVLVAGLSTPLWFYAVVFWEHAPATCLAVWAVVFHLDALRGATRALAASAALAAASVWFREEQLLLAVLLAILAIPRAARPRRAALQVLTVSFAILVPLAGFLWVTTGSPVGWHATANAEGLVPHLAGRASVFWNLWLGAGSDPIPSWILTLPTVVLFAAAPTIRDAERYSRALAGCAALACLLGAASFAGALRAYNPIEWLLEANSFFPAAPALLLGLVRPGMTAEPTAAWRRLHLIALVYAAAYTLAAPTISSAGIHWGNRFLLPLYPWLAAFAAAGVAHAWSSRPRLGWLVPACAALSLAFAIQLLGVDLLDRKKEFSRTLERTVSERPEPAIVTDQWWIGAELHSLYGKRPVFFAPHAAGLERLQPRLAAAGLRELLLVSRPRAGVAGQRIVDDGRLHFFVVALEPGKLP